MPRAAAPVRMPSIARPRADAGRGPSTIVLMWVRRAFFWWMFPAAVLLPLWILVGWIVFDASGWALLWVVFLAIPSVFAGQLVLALLVRGRASVRAERAVSWWDVLGFTVWHGLVVATGVFSPTWFAAALVLAVLAAMALFWLTLWQLLREARGSFRTVLRTADGTGYLPPRPAPPSATRDAEVIVVTETRPAD